MEKRFSVGDRVRIIKTVHHPELLGEICTVIGPLQLHANAAQDQQWMGYEVDIMTYDGLKLCPLPESLELVYDGNQRISWFECIWKPKELVA